MFVEFFTCKKLALHETVNPALITGPFWDIFLPPTLLAGPIFRFKGTFVLGGALVVVGAGVNNKIGLATSFVFSGEFAKLIKGAELELSSTEFFLLLVSDFAAAGRGEPRGEGTLDSKSVSRVNTTLGLSAVRPGWSFMGEMAVRFLPNSSGLY